MATKVFPVDQLIFVDECHKSESLFASRSLSSSAQVYNVVPAPHTGCSYHGSLTRGVRGALSAGRNEARRRRGYGFRGQRVHLHEPFTTIRVSPYWLRAMWTGLSFLHVILRRKQ
jgi:hypothetical protein